MVEIEKLPQGGYRVSRVFATKAAMQAGASALERVVPEAYEPLPVPASRVGWFEGQAIGGCTCPSGDGSLRWPCPAHPVEQASPIEPRLNGIRDDADPGIPPVELRD